jgi:class 3 adenylate cyclase/DNA-binding CsgD family transcriptional regulator/tetratricopeptide (TPR) repeat protein
VRRIPAPPASDVTDPSLSQRLTAILAADAAGFSRLMADDPRATVAALDAARQAFRAGIERHQGRVIDMAGDAVLAVFQTAAGAVEAAQAIQQALALDKHGASRRRMRFRIGIHLGDVIEKPDGTVYGDGVNVAARLQALADPGGVAVSEAVRGIVAGRIDAAFSSRGIHRLKNIAQPVHVFALRDAQHARSEATKLAAVPGALVGAAPAARPAALFVGRGAEMAQLTNALDNAWQGRGQVVLLSGSGGMGKTRLAQELAHKAEAKGMQVLWGRCLEEPGAPPYWPWRQLIRGHVRAGGGVEAAQALGWGLADIAGLVPELAAQLGAPPPEAEADDTAQTRFRLFDAVVGFWRLAAERAPLLLIFEDLHWADATSLRLLAFLAAELEDSRLMVAATYRDTELSRQHPLFETLAELARSPVFRRLELTGLSSEEAEQLMTAASGGAASASFMSAVHARTEGHPLFLEETLRLAMEARAAQPAGFDEQLLHRIPNGVREVIGKRLNRLSERAGRVLSTAACIGRSFDLALLARLEAERSEDEILQALEEALAVRLIEPVPQSQQFRFSHALIRDTIYDEMLGLRRARLHLRIGEMLEQQLADDESGILPQLAYHFSEAGAGQAVRKALDYARRSADAAARLFAFEEAARLHGLALRIQAQHFARDGSQRCELLLGLGEVHIALAAGELARVVYQEAAELARERGLPELFARAAAGYEAGSVLAGRSGEPAVLLLLEATVLHQAEDALRVELLARLCRAYVYSDRAEQARQAHQRAVALARRIGDTPGLCRALASITAAVYWPDLLKVRVAATKECLAIAQDTGLAPATDSFPYFLNGLVQAGEVLAVRRMIALALQVGEQSRSPYLQTLCSHVEALIAISEGRFDAAERWAVEALRSGRRLSADIAASTYGMQMFCLRREQGRLREAQPLLQHFVRTTPDARTWKPGLALLYAELGMRDECRAEFDGLPWNAATLAAPDAATTTTVLFAAEVCAWLEDADRAVLLYGLLAPYTGVIPMGDFGGPCLGCADRLLGQLAGTMKRWEAAERHFETALAVDEACGSRVWLAHGRYDYASMLRRRARPGDLERARALLPPARSDSAAIGMQALTPRIDALMEAIAAPPSWPGGLTDREVDVLRLIAIGRNNREIGQVLAISQHTVANHVRSILEKTYTANRTEAAAFANREGLLPG